MIRLLAINTQSPFSKLLRFVVIFTLTLIFFPIGAIAESGTLFNHAKNGGRSIEDNGGDYDGDYDRTIWEIDLFGAPADAVITGVDVEYWITHPYIRDLKVWLATEHDGEWQEYLLHDLEGGSDDNIHEKETGLTIWNGLPANRKWYFSAADFAEDDEGDIDEWKIWVHFNSASETPQDSVYNQDFSLGKPSTKEGWEYYFNNEGRIEVVNGKLRMDDTADGPAYSLNEAILHLDLSGRSGVILTLDHSSSRDENNGLPTTFIGHANGDGIAISANGINWHLLTNLTSDFQNRSFDLDAAIQSASISYTSDFCIKFQQYDNYSWPEDGRAFDNISITTGKPEPVPLNRPFGTWKGTFESASYHTFGTINNWIMRDDYITESMWELDIGSKTGMRINPSGTYSFNPLNGHLNFSYTGLVTIWVDRQITDLPCIFDVNGTVFSDDNASGSYVIRFFPPNLLPFSDSGTWQATQIPDIILHIFGIEICTGWNHNDPDKVSDMTYDFCLGVETDNTISEVEFLTPAGSIFHIPNDFHTKSGDIETWHYSIGTALLDMSPTGLIAHWKMDDNAATTTVVDGSGNGHHGTTKRYTTALTTVGMIDNALSFNGVNDYITIPKERNLITGKNDFTISGWCSLNAINSIQNLIAWKEPSSAVQFAITDGHGNTGIWAGSRWLMSTGYKFTTGTWHHITWTRNGNVWKVYINGTQIGPDVINNHSLGMPILDYHIGAEATAPSQFLNGLLDDVRIYDRALPDVEIKALFDRKKKNAERWEYIGKFTDSDALTKYGDGTYTITLHHKDGKQSQTTAWFGIPETPNAIPQPTQEPLLIFPKHNSIAISPVTFTWGPCNDTKATSKGLCLEKVGSDEGYLVDIEFPVAATNSDPIPLGPGIWQAKIFCDRWYNYDNPDGIAVEAGKFSESDYRFEISKIPDTSILIAHWKMNDNAATTTVVDSSGRGNHGTALRNTSALSVAGSIDSALAFNGINDYISVPDNPEWTFISDFTITLWVKFNTFNPKWWESAFIGHDEGPRNTNKWIFSYDPGDSKTLFHINHAGASGPIIKGNPWAAQAGVWYFIAVMRSGSTYTFYREGISDGVRIDGTVIPNASVPLTIGWAEGYATFDGALDDVRIYNRALSNTEIQELYGKQEPGYVQTPSEPGEPGEGFVVILEPGEGGNLIEQDIIIVKPEKEEEEEEEGNIIIIPLP